MICRLLVVIAMCVGLTSKSRAEDACQRLHDAIHDLGVASGVQAAGPAAEATNYNAPHEELTIQQLHACAREALPLLIAQLKVIDPESDDPYEWWHAVWVERALRSITGEYFRFRTAGDLGRLGEFRSKTDRVGYVSEWMSHAKVYVAPRDVQVRVVEAWKRWEANNGEQFVAKPFVPYGDWYW